VSESADQRWMAEAIRLAARVLNTTHPNPRVGCVIVGEGRIVGQGWHERPGGPHAEVNALREAGAAARGATAYVSLEPCCHSGRTPPCTEALISAGVSRVVYAAGDPNPRVAGGGARALAAAGIEVSAQVLEAAALALNPGFHARMSRGRPWVRSKIASSLDGRTALGNGESRWITGEAARADVQRQRAHCSAILTGIDTVLLDDPRLDLRLEQSEPACQPLRIVLDSSLRLAAGARLFSCGGQVLVLTCEADPARQAPLLAAGARIETLAAGGDGRLELGAVLQRLAELEINDVLVEAGPTLNGALLAAGLIDELLVYMAAHVLGSDARPMFTLPPLRSMDARHALRLAEVRRVGADLRLRYARSEN